MILSLYALSCPCILSTLHHKPTPFTAMGATTGESSTSASVSNGYRQAGPPSSQRSPGTQPTAAAAAASTSTEADQCPIFPLTLVNSIKPTMGAYTPHMDQLKRGLQYIVDSSVEYEECSGNGTSKGAGAADAPASYKPKKPAGRSKAILAAHAHQQAFSLDPQIHAMEDSLQAIVEMQQQMETERAALESLTNMIGQGMRLPAKDLHASFEHLLKTQAKQQQTRRKQQIKARGAPGGMEPELFDLRTKIWEVHHSRDPLPMGAGTGAGGGAEEDEDEDMEIVVSAAASVQELKCPITTNFLVDPVTSSVCKHSFSREAIMSLVRSGGRSSSLCPVHGCNRPVTVEMLQPNKTLARKVERQKMVEQELFAHEDEEYTTVE